MGAYRAPPRDRQGKVRSPRDKAITVPRAGKDGAIKPAAVRLRGLSLVLSGRPDLNRGPPAPEAGALTGLRYAPCCEGSGVRVWIRKPICVRNHYPLLPTPYDLPPCALRESNPQPSDP